MATLSETLNSIDELPTLPASVARLMSALQQDEDTAEITQIVRADEAMSAMVLRAANSSAGGATRSVTDIGEAITRVGRNWVRTLALRRGCGRMIDDAGEAYGMRRGELWRGAIGGAFACERIARHVCPEDSGAAYTAGLLRDVGKLVVELLAARDHRELAGAPDAAFTTVERDVIGWDHAEIGADLVARWSMPDRLAVAVRHHHTPPDAGSDRDRLVDIVHAGDAVCRWANLGIGDDGMQYEVDDSVMDGLGLDRKMVETLMIDVTADVRELEGAVAADGAGESP